LNLYAYTANNPITYYDPTGHNYIKIGPLYLGNPIEGFRVLSNSEEREKAYELIEEHGNLGFVGKRVYSIAAGYGEISAGMIDFGIDILDAGSDNFQMSKLSMDRQLGIIDNDLYEIKKEEIDKKYEYRREALKNAPKTIYNSIRDSAGNVINKESRYNFFVNPDTSFNELVDYSRDAISTGMTVYSAARFSHSLLESISISSTPAAVTPFGQLAPSTVNIAIDAGLAGNLFRSSGFLGGVNFATTNTKPLQDHHFATNKSKTYTKEFEKIIKKYSLDLDDPWNREFLPHRGRHPNAYHDYVLDQIKKFDSISQGDTTKFLELFEQLKKKIIDNPDMLYKDYWISGQGGVR
jgi:hypothetical protein